MCVVPLVRTHTNQTKTTTNDGSNYVARTSLHTHFIHLNGPISRGDFPNENGKQTPDSQVLVWLQTPHANHAAQSCLRVPQGSSSLTRAIFLGLLNRRRFLNYAGATAAIVGASALGLDYVLSSRPSPVNQTTTLNPITSSSKTNHPPVANFKRTPHFLNPTDEQTIQFMDNCYDADNDPLQYAWYIDGAQRSVEKNYSTKLLAGEHAVELKVSDGIAEDSVQQSVAVDPDQIYPTKPLRINYKGMIYAAGRMAPEWAVTPAIVPDIEEMNEQLSTIRSELGCNAIYLRAGAGYEDNLIEACKIALRLEFDRIYAEMKYMHTTVEETAQKLSEFAPRIKALRETSDAIVFTIGSEFVYSIKDLLPGEQWIDQLNYAVQNYNDYIKRIKEQIPKSFQIILPAIKRVYDYPVAYAAELNEANFVPWEDPVLESVCIDLYLADAYGMNEQWMLNYLEKFGKFGKPINWSEFGCLTYTGGGHYGYMTSAWATSPYDEDEQAKYIQRYCNTFSKAGIEGAYYYIYNEEWDKGFGLYNDKKRKKGFYMYKSYQRAA